MDKFEQVSSLDHWVLLARGWRVPLSHVRGRGQGITMSHASRGPGLGLQEVQMSHDRGGGGWAGAERGS